MKTESYGDGRAVTKDGGVRRALGSGFAVARAWTDSRIAESTVARPWTMLMKELSVPRDW